MVGWSDRMRSSPLSRLTWLFLLLLLAGSPLTVSAAAGPAGESRDSSPLAPQTRQLVRELVRELEDPKQREQLIARLKLLLEARAAEEAEPGVLEQFAARLRAAVGRGAAELAGAFRELLRIGRKLAVLGDWIHEQLTDARLRGLWRAALLQLAAGLVVALSGMFLLRPVTRRLRASAQAGEATPVRAALLLVAMRVLTVGVFTVLFGITLALAGAPPALLRAAFAVLAGLFVGRSVAALADALLAPRAPARRLLQLDDRDAHSLARTVALLNLLLVYGTAAFSALYDLGLPATLHLFFLQLDYLAAVAVALVALFRWRVAVAAFLERRIAALSPQVRRFVPAWSARYWHLPAAALVVGDYLAFLLRIEGATYLLLRALLATVAIVLLARAALLFTARLFARAEPPPAEESGGFASLRPRYLAILHQVLRAAIVVLAAGLLLQLWGIDLYGWLATPLGRALLGTAGQLLLLVVITVAVIEGGTQIARHYLEATTPEGRPVYGARARTLVSIASNGLVVVMFLIAAFWGLSILGVDTGPLLAGAGIVGLAIGFGSQKLIQDLITGLFILSGDTVRIGDVVAVGGHAGVVEAMSMRTITLRSYDGNLHVVPYSSIDTITNMTKDFSFWVMDIAIAYKEDVDRVMEVLRELDAEMRQDPDFRTAMMAPIEIAGLDRFGDSAVIIKARLKTRPGSQWQVGREFQRRLKKRFDELGIEIPFPHRTLFFGTDARGRPPALLLRTEPGSAGG